MSASSETIGRDIVRGIVLFAHGARDPRWAEPFERLRDRVAARAPDAPLSLAFLEFMQPDLAAAATALVDAGCGALTIVPVFLGQGGHLRRDLPALVDALRVALPAVDIRVAGPVGEDDAVLDAMARYCSDASGIDAPTSGVR